MRSSPPSFGRLTGILAKPHWPLIVAVAVKVRRHSGTVAVGAIVRTDMFIVTYLCGPPAGLIVPLSLESPLFGSLRPIHVIAAANKLYHFQLLLSSTMLLLPNSHARPTISGRIQMGTIIWAGPRTGHGPTQPNSQPNSDLLVWLDLDHFDSVFYHFSIAQGIFSDPWPLYAHISLSEHIMICLNVSNLLYILLYLLTIYGYFWIFTDFTIQNVIWILKATIDFWLHTEHCLILNLLF